MNRSSTTWENAFLQAMPHAELGRLLTGFLHELNGCCQAYTLQSAILREMFGQAKGLLIEASRQSPTPLPALDALGRLLSQRETLVGQMEAKAAALQEVLRRIQPVIPNSLSPSDSMPLQRVIELAAGALKFDLFFKHKVAKEIMVAEGLPPVRQGASLLQSAVYLLLRNALEAVRDQDERRVAVRAGANGAVVEIRVEDNGPGVPGEILPRLGEPFVSSKPSHAGLGLHLARVVMEDRGGTLRHERADGLTRFILAFPVEP